MKNRLYYIGLNLLSLIFFIFVVKKAKKREKRYIIPLFFTYSGLNYLFEFIILIVFRSYRYKPNIFKNNYFDNIFGASVSQLFVVPITGLFISILNLKDRWKFFFSLILTCVEIIFVKEKIFQHNWWKTPFTTIGLQVYYAVASYWKKQIIENENGVFKAISVFLSIFTSYSTLNFYHVSLLKTCVFTINIFKNKYRSHTFFSTVYSGLSAILFTIIIYYRNWYMNSFTTLALFGFELLLSKVKIIKVNNILFYFASILTKLISFSIGRKIHGMLYEEQKKGV